MRKTKIAIICENYPPDDGGIAKSAERLALSLSKTIEIHVIRFPRGEPDQSFTYNKKQVSSNLYVHVIAPFVNGWTIPPDPGLRAMILHTTVERLVSILSNVKVDIIHGFGLQNAGLVASRVSHLLGIQLIQSVRGNDVGRNSFDGSRRVELALALVNAQTVVAVNQWVADLLRINFPWTAERIKIIPNGVETPSPFSNSLTEKLAMSLKLSQGGPIVGFVGTLREKKGPHLFFELIRNFIIVHNGRLLIIGDVDLALFQEIGWRGGSFDRFVIVRKAKNPSELYSLINLCDWLVFPSLDDGMANGLLESMVCGRTVVCSSVFSDVIRNWQDGVIVSPLNPFEYVSVCEMLWNNPEMRKVMGASARKRVENDFNIANERALWLELFREITSGVL